MKSRKFHFRILLFYFLKKKMWKKTLFKLLYTVMTGPAVFVSMFIYACGRVKTGIIKIDQSNENTTTPLRLYPS